MTSEGLNIEVWGCITFYCYHWIYAAYNNDVNYGKGFINIIAIITRSSVNSISITITITFIIIFFSNVKV